MIENKNVIYDAENENNHQDDFVFQPQDENTSHVVYDAETDGQPYSEEDQTQKSEYEIDENQKNVFENGLDGGQFVRTHNCPMCMVGKKTISELYMKKRFSRKKKVVGYASICANCGFVSFYTTNINDLLSLFRGKINF